VSGELYAPASLPPGKEAAVPIGWGQGGPQSRSGRRGEEKILDPTGTRTPTPQSSSPWPVAIPNTIARLLIVEVNKLTLFQFFLLANTN
jgi:hypothetical protein